MHALIIEDEALIAMTIEQILRTCGFTSFEFAASNDEAIFAAKRVCPDLITADNKLNPGCGIDAVNEICSGSPIPVVFITGSPLEVEERMPRHPLVCKPFTADDLSAAVALALANFEAGAPSLSLA